MGTLAMTDIELVEASRRGEREAFGRLVARYQDVVWAVSFSSTGNRALGEDVAQETFIAAWRRLDQLRDAVQIRPWLCTIARNLARKARRRTWREETADAPDSIAVGNPFDAAAQAESERVVRDALERIPEGYREVLVLYYRENRSVREVAGALGMTEAAVMQRLTRGRKYLADSVTELVERSLRGARPRKDLVGGVVAAIGPMSPIKTKAAAKGSTMMKVALLAAVIGGAGTTAYVVHSNAQVTTSPSASPSPSPSASPIPTPSPTRSPSASASPSPSPSPKAPVLTVQPRNGAFDHPDDDSRVMSKQARDKLGLETGPSRGPANAPVTIVVFQDNLCPYCGHALGTLDQLMDEYPSKLRIVVKQFVVHESARLSAEACYAADAQGKFWDMHDAIMAHQDDLSHDALIADAKQIGLDVPRFTLALDRHEYARQVAEDMAAGKEVGVRGTPAFLINGREISGAQPIENFRAVIDAALADLK